MTVIDYLVIGIVDYLLLGIGHAFKDYQEPLVNRRGYTYGSNPIIIVLSVLAWPFFVMMDCWVKMRMREDGIFSLVISEIIGTVGLVLWTCLWYLVAGFFVSSSWGKAIIAIPLLLVSKCLFGI